MKWHIGFSADSLKFIKRNNLKEDFAIEKIRLAVRKFQGENVNLDIKKLGGEWQGFHRIRSGKLRIIVEFRFDHCRAYVANIDWRGNIYK